MTQAVMISINKKTEQWTGGFGGSFSTFLAKRNVRYAAARLFDVHAMVDHEHFERELQNMRNELPLIFCVDHFGSHGWPL